MRRVRVWRVLVVATAAVGVVPVAAAGSLPPVAGAVRAPLARPALAGPVGAVSEFGVPGSATPCCLAGGPHGDVWFAGGVHPVLGHVSLAGVVEMVGVPARVLRLGRLVEGANGDVFVMWEVAGPRWFVAELTPAGQLVQRGSSTVPLSGPGWLAAGTDGSVWASESGHDIVRFTPGKAPVSLVVTGGQTRGVAIGGDGDVWVAAGGVDRVARLDPAGREVASYALPVGADPQDVAVAADGSVWVAERGLGALAKLIPTSASDASVTQVPLPAVGSAPTGLVAGADGNLWVNEAGTGRVARVGLHGAVSEFGLPGQLYPTGIAAGGDGNVWVAEQGRLARVSTGVAPAATLTTVAGDGTFGYSGDGGPAIKADLVVNTLAFDASGDIYIADFVDNRVRKVTPQGVITTFAGTGTAGFSGDGGPAASAELHSPAAVTVDAAGDVIISDTGNNRLREVSASGMITTIAGTGAGQGSPPDSGDGGPAIEADLGGPLAVTIGPAGDIYVIAASSGLTDCVRRISQSGIISGFAGNGQYVPHGPNGDGGPAVDASLDYGVASLATDRAGNVYLADFNRVRKVNTAGIISTIAGTSTIGDAGTGGPATAAQLNGAQGITVDAAGNVYVADELNGTVREILTDGAIITVAGVGVLTPHPMPFPARSLALGAGLNPLDLAADPSGQLYLGDLSDVEHLAAPAP